MILSFRFYYTLCEGKKCMLLLGALKKALKAYLHLNSNFVDKEFFFMISDPFQSYLYWGISNRAMSLYVCRQHMIVYVVYVWQRY